MSSHSSGDWQAASYPGVPCRTWLLGGSTVPFSTRTPHSATLDTLWILFQFPHNQLAQQVSLDHASKWQRSLHTAWPISKACALAGFSFSSKTRNWFQFWSDSTEKHFRKKTCAYLPTLTFFSYVTGNATLITLRLIVFEILFLILLSLFNSIVPEW